MASYSISPTSGSGRVSVASSAFTATYVPDVVEAVPVDLALDFSAASADSLLTTSILTTAKIGGTGYTFENYLGASHGGTAMERTHLIEDETAPSYAVPMAVDGSSYTGAGDLVIRIDSSTRTGDDSKWEGFRAIPPTVPTPGSCTVAGFVKPGSIGGAALALQDLVGISNAGGGGGGSSPYAVLQQSVAMGGTTGVVHAHSENTIGSAAPVSSTWYRFDLRLNTVDGYAEALLRDPVTGEIAMASRIASGPTGFNEFFLWDYLIVFGGESRYKGIVMASGDNATFPLGALVVSDPASVVAEQTAATEVTLTWDVQAFTCLIERQKNGGAWTTLAAAHEGTEYVDEDIAAADVVSYRVTAKINEHSSAAVTSNEVEVTSPGGEIVFDTMTADGSNLPSVTHAQGALTNGCAVVMLCWSVGTATDATVTYGGAAMTHLRTDITLGYAVALYVLDLGDSAAGNKSVVLTLNGTVNEVLTTIATYSGVLQGATITHATAEGFGTDIAVSVPTLSASELVLGGCSGGGSSITAGQTAFIEYEQGSRSHATQYTTGTGGTVSLTWTQPSQNWRASALVLEPA